MRPHLIVGYNGTPGSADALALALALADGVPADALEITVAAIRPLDPYGLVGRAVRSDGDPDLDEAAEAQLAAAREVCGHRPGVSFTVRAAASPSRALHLLADEEDAEMIVVGRSHTGPIGRAFLGSVTEQTLLGATCPVAVAPRGYAETEHELATIAVAFDGSDGSESALDQAAALARGHGATLRLTSVVEPRPVAYGGMVDPSPVASRRADAQRLLDTACAGVDGVALETVVLSGDAVPALSELDGTADLLVTGSRGHGPLGRILLGSVGSRLARHCPAPLLVVPHATAPDGEVAAAA